MMWLCKLHMRRVIHLVAEENIPKWKKEMEEILKKTDWIVKSHTITD